MPSTPRPSSGLPEICLLGLATALPPHVLTQDGALDRARTILAPCYPQFERISGAFENAGIDRRYSVAEMDWVFGDGAAAAVLGPGDAPAPLVGAGVQQMWPDTLNIIGWDVDDIGLGVIFDRSIPGFVSQRLAEAFAATEDALGPARVARHVCDPGGAKVVTAIEEALALPPSSLDVEREVLRDARQHVRPDGAVRAATGAGAGRDRAAGHGRARAGLHPVAAATGGLGGRCPVHRLPGPVSAGQAGACPPAWLACIAGFGLGQPVNPLWLAIFALLHLLRVWILATIGPRWTTRIIVLDEPLSAAARSGSCGTRTIRSSWPKSRWRRWCWGWSGWRWCCRS